MSEWPETSESLIVRLKDPQDVEAWTQIVAIYRPVVYRMARGRGLQHEDAEDLSQSVLVSIMRAIDTWQPKVEGPRFRNWLGRIARNAILNALTRVKPDQAAGTTSVVAVLQSIPEAPELTATLMKQVRMEAIRRAAKEVQGEFAEATWAIFQATAIEGRAIAEVARTMNRSVGAIYTARCRVVARIREKVEESSGLWSQS